VLPVIQSGPLQRFVVDQKAEGRISHKSGTDGDAGATDVSGILGDFRLMQDNMQQRICQP
jgi:hypothetical protein